MKRVLLVGAGHAHAALLAAAAKTPLYGARITLVTPHAAQLYSGMLPGVVAGHYRLEEAQFDVAHLAERCFADLVVGKVRSLDPNRRAAILPDTHYCEFDLDDLLRGDSAARAAFYSAGITGGWLTPNDIRPKERLKPVSWGDEPYLPHNTSADAQQQPQGDQP